MTQEALKCPIPENENERLQAVLSYDVLDTPPELDFDALTRIAAHAFNVPAALVGLMDADRLWFKSRLGLDVPQLDRELAFCAYAVMRPDELLVVEDLSKDPRFENNPLVTQAPNLRFYAGAPLVESNGYALGTIAVVDNKPRTLNDDERAILKDISTLVVTALESRRRANMLGRLALTDHLTGLANRPQFDRVLESEVAHSKRTGTPFSLLYLDLDGFKVINDQYGHAAGDEVLREVAHRLVKAVRTEDIVARFGGDEFGVVVRSSPQDPAHKLAERITQEISVPIALSRGASVEVGVSVGIATCTRDVATGAILRDMADSSLYESKRQRGRR